MSQYEKPLKTIILIHGLSRRREDMWFMERRLRRLLPGYPIFRFGYKSTQWTIAQMVAALSEYIKKVAPDGEVYFVGHSLGGLLVRKLACDWDGQASLKRLIALGSPVHGSKMARFARRIPPIRFALGIGLSELCSWEPFESPIETGTIIGCANRRFGFNPFFGEDNDGLVTVSEATLLDAKDTARVFVFHGLFPLSRRAAQLSARFIRCGSFSEQLD
jgi:pimeloyl-ACP methyl ester carboxylesterase